MSFEYKENEIPSLQELIELYDNVGWRNYVSNPKMLEKAYQNSLFVITVWDAEKIIGVIRVVGDGHSIVYIQDLLVIKEYQHKGIGTELLTSIMNKYKDTYQIVLITDNEDITKKFYSRMGMITSDHYGCISFLKFNM